MPIHEVSLIRPENLHTQEQLVIDGVDVSGHWSTFIESRAITDYNEAMQEEIAALPGGEHVHRCWQCGSCTNSCTVNAINPEFNPRYWIYLIRLGMESEILRDKDIIWQCVSCNKCTYACPRDVVPEGVMKALSHWLELKGHVAKSPSMVFDEVFSEQVFQRGKIEEGRVMQRFFKRTGQDLQAAVADRDGEADAAPPAAHDADKARPRDARCPEHQRLVGCACGHRGVRARQEHKRRRALGLDGLIEAAKRDAGPAAAGQGART